MGWIIFGLDYVSGGQLTSRLGNRCIALELEDLGVKFKQCCSVAEQQRTKSRIKMLRFFDHFSVQLVSF
jgi:hypothetical protein